MRSLLLLLACAPGLWAQERTPSTTAACPIISVRFSPQGGCTDLVAATLRAARREVRASIYNFTSDGVLAAFVSLAIDKRDVKLILDVSNLTSRKSSLPYVHKVGIECRIDRKHPIQHNKVAIVDGETVLTGSFNWTGNAERNAENCLTIRDPALAHTYLEDWERHWAHSEPYAP